MYNDGVIFTGQGSQFSGMGQELIANSNIAQNVYNQASQICNLNLESISFGEESNLLNNTEFAQLAIVTYEYATFRSYVEQTKKLPHAVAGHSLGELTALCAAGVICFPDLLLLVQERGRLMQKAADQRDGGMMAILNCDHKVDEIANQFKNVYISNLNSSSQTVYSGDKKSLMEFGKVLKTKNYITVNLNTSGAFHSPYMQEIVSEYQSVLDSFIFDIPYIPVYSNVNAELYPNNEDTIKKLLVEQLITSVKWIDIMKKMKFESKCTRLIECGPKKTLLNFIPFKDVKKGILNSVGKIEDVN